MPRLADVGEAAGPAADEDGNGKADDPDEEAD